MPLLDTIVFFFSWFKESFFGSLFGSRALKREGGHGQYIENNKDL